MVMKIADAYNRLVLSHRFARYNKGIVFGIAAIISAVSLYYGNDAVSTIADAFGVVGGVITPNADAPAPAPAAAPAPTGVNTGTPPPAPLPPEVAK